MSQMSNLISKVEARGGAAAEEGRAKAEQERTERERIRGPVGARRVTLSLMLLSLHRVILTTVLPKR